MEDEGLALVHTRGLSPLSPFPRPHQCVMLVLPRHPSDNRITLLARSAVFFK